MIQDEVDGSVVTTTPSETLNKIQSMLDTTKVSSSCFNLILSIYCIETLCMHSLNYVLFSI